MKRKTEEYENGETGLIIHTMDDGSRNYWIRGGVGIIEFPEEQFRDLLTLLVAYAEEEQDGLR